MLKNEGGETVTDNFGLKIGLEGEKEFKELFGEIFLFLGI